MKRERFEQYIKNMPEGSVKKACFIVKEYLKGEGFSAVDKEEASVALGLLLSYCYENSKYDTFVEEYYCKGDCIFNNSEEFPFCPGEFSLANDAKTLCKYYKNSINS